MGRKVSSLEGGRLGPVLFWSVSSPILWHFAMVSLYACPDPDGFCELCVYGWVFDSFLPWEEMHTAWKLH